MKNGWFPNTSTLKTSLILGNFKNKTYCNLYHKLHYYETDTDKEN